MLRRISRPDRCHGRSPRRLSPHDPRPPPTPRQPQATSRRCQTAPFGGSVEDALDRDRKLREVAAVRGTLAVGQKVAGFGGLTRRQPRSGDRPRRIRRPTAADVGVLRCLARHPSHRPSRPENPYTGLSFDVRRARRVIFPMAVSRRRLKPFRVAEARLDSSFSKVPAVWKAFALLRIHASIGAHG